MMLVAILIGLLCVTSSLGGSICPPRENIYPCNCVNVHQSKKIIHTIVNCHRLHGSDVLGGIFNQLRTVQIDQFHLYDSFWESDKLGNLGESRKTLPTDWLTLLKIKEIEIVDTALSSCFACNWKMTCRNSITTRFTAVNSSSSEKICSLCDTGTGSKYPWTGCLSRLKHFHYSYGKLRSLGADLFPLEMRELSHVNLTHNQITTIDPKTFKNLKRLSVLDLSHNALEYIDTFINQDTILEFLDVSWNNIKTLGKGLFKHLPLLINFNLNSNFIMDLKEEEWKDAPGSIKYIYINDNPLNCDCNIRWINSTFHVSVVIEGTCLTPEEYENSQLRKASRFMVERCDDDGIVGTRKRFSTTPVSKF